MKTLILTVLLSISTLLYTPNSGNTQDLETASTGFRIAGRVLDASDEPVTGALVILFDQETGIPINPETSRPFTEDIEENGWKMSETLSGQEGRFEFGGLKEGSYRVIGETVITEDGHSGEYLAVSKEVMLRGLAENIEVPSAAAQSIELKPLGTGSLYIARHSPNNEHFLFLSTAPTLADPAVGFAGWGTNHLRNLVGLGRMSYGEMTVSGLPEGVIYATEFAADNSPGFGAGSAVIKEGGTTEIYIPLVAGWSNGVHTPPERLKPLYDDAIAGKISLAVAVRKNRGQMPKDTYDPRVWDEWLSTLVTLEDGREVTIADIMAVDRYVSLYNTDIERARYKKINSIKSQTPETGSSYYDAFRDLYFTLFEKYPGFALKGIDWEAVGEEFLPRAEEVEGDDAFGLLCIELMARLKDSHAHLMTGTAEYPKIHYPKWHPGFACLVDDRSMPVVYFVGEGTSAGRAGIKPGLILVSINGQPAEDVIKAEKEHLSKYSGYSSERYLNYHAYRFFIRQMNQGETVKLEFVDVDGKTRKFEVLATVDGGYLPRLPVPIAGINDSADVAWKMLDGDVGYIYVRRIKGDLIESLDKAVGELKDSRGIIIDVRGNSGGGFDNKRSFVNFDLDNNELEPERPRFKGNLALLTDARCISAGEGWASWFIANERAHVFGEATAGASARKTVYELKNGLYKARFPVKFYKGSLGRPIEMIGLIPDVPLMQNADDLAAGRDTVLEAAREYLIEKTK